MTEAQILASYPWLRAADLVNAWASGATLSDRRPVTASRYVF
jgi:uncharacterized protein (DUF433 family)